MWMDCRLRCLSAHHLNVKCHRLSNYVEFKKPCSVHLGDNRSILAYRKGTYHVKVVVGNYTQKLALQEVLYLPELERNLLSLHAMVKRGATLIFKEDKREISRNSRILDAGEIEGKLYTLKIAKEHANIAKKQPDTNLYLWHCRFGHLGMNSVSTFINENMVNGMDGVSKEEEN